MYFVPILVCFSFFHGSFQDFAVMFQSSLRMHHGILNQKIAREHFYSQANYEFMFILSDTKNGKNRGTFDNLG